MYDLFHAGVGNRNLGWDLLPPGSPSFEVTEEEINDANSNEQYHSNRSNNNNNNTRSNVSTTEPFVRERRRYAGYHQYPPSWNIGSSISETTVHNGSIDDDDTTIWYAGHQYDGDVFRAKSVLENITHYMGYNDNDDDGHKDGSINIVDVEYEITGIFFWQGDRDAYSNDCVYAQRYDINLRRFFSALRIDFQAPRMKVVLATLGQTALIDEEKDVDRNAKKYSINEDDISSNNDGEGITTGKGSRRWLKEKKQNNAKASRIKMQERLVFNAQMELPKQSSFLGNAATVYTYPLVQSYVDNNDRNSSSYSSSTIDSVLPSSTNHYKHSLDIYMKVGFAMGKSMADLLLA